MSLTNPKNVVTEERLSEFYGQILPYLGGMPEALANKFSKSDLYSTDEKIIGCWINGKPLYQKTIVTTMPTAGNSKNVAIGANVEWGTYDAQVISSGAIQKLPVIKPGSTSYTDIEWSLRCAIVPNSASSNKNTIMLESKGNASYDNMPTYITVQYTKTTDAANSFKYGNETDYSTSEKIIGTWIDGKPIYQKVITGTTPATVADSDVRYVSIGANVKYGWVVGGFIVSSAGALPSLNTVLYSDVSGGTAVRNWAMISSNASSENKNTLRIRTSNSNWTNLPFYAVVQYTKTTD